MDETNWYCEFGGTCTEVEIVSQSNNCEGIDIEYVIDGDLGLFNLFYPDIYEVYEDSTAWYVNGEFVAFASQFDYTFPNPNDIYEVCAFSAAFHLGTETWCVIEICQEVPIFCPSPIITYQPVNDSMYIFGASLQAPPYQLGDVSWNIDNNVIQGNSVSYVFHESGTYDICPVANINEQDGSWFCTSENNCFSLTVEIGNQQNDCEASFEWQDNGNINDINTVTFTNTSTGN